MRAGLIDCITTPAQGNKLPDGVRFCADNGKFGKGWPGVEAWFGWLQRQNRELCAFAVAPDVPFDSLATLDESLPWCPRIRDLGIPVAVVAQNRFEDIAVVPWDEFDVLFLGGNVECVPCGYVHPDVVKEPTICPSCNCRWMSEWKTGDAARAVTAEAKRHGKQVHMGRVNTATRFRHALHIGCDSADGTYLTFGPDINLPKLLGWLRLNDQGDLLGAAS